ncbi:hypothetical protein PR202_gb27471 [Eleusine coracana subsp. coracana]|uniref:Uncharacterized protein n=1 Tax=Eleusine coracana subsp. coracana TaxID=191504 RepID=A0AAV5FU99_ELECO|nr:hypothetical protein PR202_gb27471 [Eleusine coracana subsp. coracana]
MALPQLVVLEGIGSDVVWAGEVQMQQRHPESDKVVFVQGATGRMSLCCRPADMPAKEAASLHRSLDAAGSRRRRAGVPAA